MHTDFATDARFDNPRAVQIRLPGFNLDSLVSVGARVRDLFAAQATDGNRVRTVYSQNELRRDFAIGRCLTG